MYIESDVLYAYLKPTDWLKKYSEEILKLKDLKTSAITIIELEIVSKRDFDEEFANSILDKIKKVNNLQIVELNKKILEKAVEIRKQHHINIFDSIHAATTIELNEKIIISSDYIYDAIKEIQRKDPRTFK